MVKLCCYPEELKCLLVGTTDRDKHFQTNIGSIILCVIQGVTKVTSWPRDVLDKREIGR